MARSRSGSKSRGNNFTKNDIEKSDFLVLRDSATGVIKKVIAPNGLQVGLLDENFLADVFVTGHISGSGVIRSKQGFTGSLTKLHTGGDYLKAGTNISLTTGSDGSVTISTAASFTGTTTEVLTIGDGLQLDSGTTFDGSAARTLSLDIAGQSTVTPASGDLILIADVDDSNNLKKVTVSSIQASLDIAGLSDSLTESTVATGDLFAIADIDDGNNVKKITFEDVAEKLGSEDTFGIRESAGRLWFKMSGLDTLGVALDPASDTLVVDDTSDATLLSKKITIATLVDAIRGTTTTTGLNSSSGVLNVDINSQGSVTAATDDEVLIYDISSSTLKKTTVSSIQGAGAAIDIAGLSDSLTESTLESDDLFAVADVNDGDTVKKITTEDFGQYLASGTNTGIGESSGKLTIDLNDLSAATVAVASDSIAFIDSDDNTTKKDSIVDLVSGIAGSGLTATSGQLSLTNSSVTITAGDGLKDGGSVSLGGSVTLNVDVSDFAGTGLEDDGSENLRIASSGIGTGLSGGSGTAISVDFGNTSTQVAKGSNTITLVPGDGLTTGGTATIGNAATNLTVDINPTDFAGTGLKVASNDLVIDDSIVATLTGSTFSGDLIVTGSVYATGILSGSSVKATKLSGSLTTLTDGSPYLIAGDNILITTGSSGAITITGSSYTAGTGLNLNGYEFSVDNSIVATLTGSQFSGNVGVTGSLGVTSFVTSSIFRGASLSGSLTTLQDGSAYLRAGNNITITTSSLGFITITSTATGSVSGSNTSFLNITASNGLTGTLANSGSNLELQIDNSVVATLTGSIFTGNVIFESGVSGSLQALSDGTAYIVGTGSIDVSTGSNGQIIISGSVVSETNPASPVNSVQFNNSGIFGGDSDFVYDSSNNVLTLSGTIQQLTASIFSTDYSGSVSLVAAHDLDSNLTFRLPEQDGLKFQFLQTDSDGNLSFDYSDRVHIQVRNNSGYDLDAGTPVYITGYNAGGDRAYIAASSASLDSTMPAAAILAEDLINNSNGHAALIGFLEGVDTSLFTVGNTLYVAADGGLTDSKPLDADVLIQNVGFVLKAANNGIMYVTSPGRTNDVPNNLIGRAGLSGSLQMLADGVTRYLIGTGSVSVSTSSNGQVVVSGSDTIYTAGTGLDLTDYQFSIDNSVVATLTGSIFSGDVIFQSGMSGSLQSLSDGTAYIIGTGSIGVSTGSNGQIVVSGSNPELYTAGTGLQINSYEFSIDDSIVATLTGSQFSGNVGVTGSIEATSFFSGSMFKAPILSGSLTTLHDGSAYLIAGNGISISTGSDGSITITGSVGDITGVTAGTGLLGGGDTGTVTLNVDDSVVATLTSSVSFSNGISGSLQSLSDGTAYMIGTGSIDVSTGSNGQIVISGSEGAIYTAGTGLNLTDYQFSIDDSVVATLTGSTFSGNVIAPAFSGSLTHLQDGTSYLIAGSNVTISTGSNGAVTISSSGGGGGSITTVSGSTSVSNVSTIRFGPGLIMNEDASGIASVTASIGEAEDGSYLDGLFTDFNPLTPIGTAIDRFNEILSALSPSPAPNLDDLSETITNGITAFLSFGASSDQTLESPAYPSVLDTAGIGDEVDINESYSFTSSGNDIRLGIYDGTQAISGILNDDVSSNNQGGGSYVNYPANSFGDGDTGVLKLEVNGSVVKEIDLTVETGTGTSGAGSASYLNANGSGFTSVSEATNGTFSNGNTFATFKHRTGNYVVATSDQRNGWNYLRVQHVKSGSTTTTNYVEWVNDNNSDALSSSNNNLEFEGSGSIHVSGVEYFQSGTLTYNNKVDNAYKYIYDTNNITFSTSNSATLGSGQSFSFSSQTKPTIDTGTGEDHTKALHLTASSAITANYFINGTVTVGSNVTHPLKSNLSNSGQSTVNQILMYNLSNTSTALAETFRRENFRLISGSYDLQGDVTDVANVWDSTIYMTASNAGHSDGLQFYNSTLLSPINTLNSGDFSGFSNGPSENPDYSGETGTRTFIRWFKNETGSTQYDLSLAINGSGTLVNEGSTLNTTNITVLIKFPGSTGWMDISQPFTLDSISDGDGAHIDNDDLNFDSTLNATNYINFGNVGIADDDYIVLKVLADESWTGNISQITVAFGAGTGTLSAVPDLDDIDSDNTGDVANLSFGSSKSITGYTNHGTTAGFSAIDLNGLVETAESSNNIRSAVFDGTEIFEGDLNEDISSPGNDYVDNAFSDANSGSLKLEVNGSIVHELEITGSYDLVGSGDPGSGTGTSLNANGSGFISLSNWGPGLFDNGVPRYSEIQRTARYRVTTSDQRNGWNYVRVIHSGTFGERTTNYVEWINDNDSNALSQAGNNLGIFGDNSFSYISGVKYFNSPSGSLETRISNIYRNVYSDSSSAISFTNLTNATASKIIQSGSGLSSTKSTSSSTDSLQTLNTNPDSQNEILHVTGTLNFSRSKSLPGTYTTSYNCAGAMIFVHPLKSNLTTTTQTTTNLLVWTPSDTSNANTDEYFTGETYRLVSGSYTAQSDVSGGTNDWDSQTSMNDQATYPEHATGLLIYDTYLLAPKDGGSSGDFRNHEEGGSIESPAGNVDYSSLTNSTRDYFRSYLNNTTNDRPSVQITIHGDATIVGRVGANAGTLGSNKNIYVEVGIPGKTGLLDLGRPSAGSGNYNEGDGCLSGDLDATVDGAGAVNTCTFNGRTVDGTVSGAEYLVIRISASENWTGYLDRITVGWS